MLSDRGVADLLREARVIAVVGASSNTARDSHTAVHYLREAGYRVYPINPHETEVAGEPAFASLAGVPEPIDIVDVFRRAEETPAVAREAVEAGAKALWLQTGITSAEARRISEEAGLAYVEDRCIYTTHRLMSLTGMVDTAGSDQT